MNPINKRRIATCIILTIVTGGIYGIYWYYLLVKNIRAITKDDNSCTGEMLCLILVPFYSVYWWYTRGRIVKDQFAEHDYSAKGSEIAYLILSLFGLGIVSMAIMQSDFNALPSESAKKTFFGVFMNGLVFENPTFVLMLGMCPTLGVTTMAINGIGMGLATTFVLLFANLFISLLRNVIPDKIRIPAFIVVIASFVTMVELLMKAFLPDLSAALGVYIPLIVVNCIIMARAESFAFKNGPVLSIADGLGMGLGYTAAITILAMIRELFGSGTIFGVQIMSESYVNMDIMLKAPGGFIVLGILLIVVNAIRQSIDHAAKKEADA